jgi:hypothetical protein
VTVHAVYRRQNAQRVRQAHVLADGLSGAEHSGAHRVPMCSVAEYSIQHLGCECRELYSN